MTWQEYYDYLVATGSSPELAQNVVGRKMDIYQSYDWDEEAIDE